jgi:putative transposase
MARLVVPGYPHHVTQRGNRRQCTFFEKADYQTYVSLLSALKTKAGVDIWAYCLMPNHVHLVAVPLHKKGLAKLFGVAHHRYARLVNGVHGWQGHLWQERFYSTPLDERHLMAAVRYIELNPVRAGLCRRAEDWRWSSVRAHLHGAPDPLVDVTPLRERITDWSSFLSEPVTPEMTEVLRQCTRNGHPAGSEEFIDALEVCTGRRLRPRKRGPVPRSCRQAAAK